ncbi:MAG TPA: MraY family glycosyltransferase [Steroidobacteraceae bacterium]|nr:MraY family glycosyltransferase [Steroidobacteraceae bacterium]
MFPIDPASSTLATAATAGRSTFQLIVGFFVALAITTILIPLLARVAPALGLTDAPGPRKVHSVPMPRIGGIAMACGILVPGLLVLEPTSELLGLLLGVLVLLAVGVWDDRVDLDYRVKFAGQMLAVGLCVFVGHVRIENIALGAPIELPAALATGLTFVFLLGVTNAVNLADGLDGLAGGLALLCFCGIAVLAAAGGNVMVMTVAAIQGGAILAFLRFNTHPARVFMGDGGSQVLGFTIGVLAILVTQNEVSTASAALPLLLVGIPIIDTAAVMVWRMRQGRSPFTSDRNHLHHRLLSLGFSHGEAVAILYLLQAELFLLVYFLRLEEDTVILGVFLTFAGLLLGILHLADRHGWRAHAHSAGEGGTERSRPLQNLVGRFPTAMVWSMSVGVLAYAAIAIAQSRVVGADLGTLCLALIALLALSSGLRGTRTGTWLERLAAYVGVVLIVYLDQTTPAKPQLMSDLSWILLGVAAAAALLRFALLPAKRFEVTSLDVLIVFIAIVVPNLPGSLALPAALSEGIGKALVLLYVTEILFTLDFKRPVSRACVMALLALIAARAYL